MGGKTNYGLSLIYIFNQIINTAFQPNLQAITRILLLLSAKAKITLQKMDKTI